MRMIERKAIGMVVIAVAMSLVTSGAVSAHDAACELRLREAPIETAELPPGWDWDFFTLESNGAPSFEASIDAGGFEVSLELSCVSDPEGLFDRLEELRRVAGNDKIGVIEIGDESLAAREFSEFPTIRWRHGDIIGQLRACDQIDYGEMEEFAQQIDGLLSSDPE